MGEPWLRESMLLVQGHTAGKWRSLYLSPGKSDSWELSLGLPWEQWKMSLPWPGAGRRQSVTPRNMTAPQEPSGGSILKTDIVTHPKGRTNSINGKTEAQRQRMICPKLPRELDLEPGLCRLHQWVRRDIGAGGGMRSRMGADCWVVLAGLRGCWLG